MSRKIITSAATVLTGSALLLGAVPATAAPAAPPEPSVEAAAAADGFPVTGGILARFTANGGAATVGTPIMAARTLADGGVYQEFRLPDGRVNTIYWSPATGAHMVRNWSRLGRAWINAGREHTSGYPLTEEVQVYEMNTYQAFHRGSRTVYFGHYQRPTPVDTLHLVASVASDTAIGQYWLRAGGPSGKLGVPTSGEYKVPGTGEVRQDFNVNNVLTWSPVTRQVTYSVNAG